MFQALKRPQHQQQLLLCPLLCFGACPLQSSNQQEEETCCAPPREKFKDLCLKKKTQTTKKATKSYTTIYDHTYTSFSRTFTSLLSWDGDKATAMVLPPSRLPSFPTSASPSTPELSCLKIAKTKQTILIQQ